MSLLGTFYLSENSFVGAARAILYWCALARDFSGGNSTTTCSPMMTGYTRCALICMGSLRRSSMPLTTTISGLILYLFRIFLTHANWLVHPFPMLAPDVLLRVPLRLLNALGGIDSVAHLPSSPLLARHFVRVTTPLISTSKALSFNSYDFNSPITLCYNEFATVIVLRTLSSPFGNIGPISVMWYTCLNKMEWWCEFSTLAAIKYFYDVLHVSLDSAYVVQIAQSPPSAMSFFRPYSRGGQAFRPDRTRSSAAHRGRSTCRRQCLYPQRCKSSHCQRDRH